MRRPTAKTMIPRVQDRDGGFEETSPCFSSTHTSMAISGHICAHNVHPVHCSMHSVFAGKYPLVLNSLSMTITPFGHASMQYLHPLQRSLLMVMLPFIHAFPGCSAPNNSLAWVREISVTFPLSIRAISSTLSSHESSFTLTQTPSFLDTLSTLR